MLLTPKQIFSDAHLHLTFINLHMFSNCWNGSLLVEKLQALHNLSQSLTDVVFYRFINFWLPKLLSLKETYDAEPAFHNYQCIEHSHECSLPILSLTLTPLLTFMNPSL